MNGIMYILLGRLCIRRTKIHESVHSYSCKGCITFIFASMKVRIINKSHHPLPGYATPLSAGMDIRANLSESVVLKPLERKLIPTGLYISLPEGYEAQMRPRSGLALKHGITLLNTPGTIDADYRGGDRYHSRESIFRAFYGE